MDAGVASLSVTPTTGATWFGGPTVSFQATLVNSSEAVTWQLSGPGTLSPTTGLSVSYTPPPSGSFSTQAIIQANTASGLMAQAVVTVGLTPVLTVSPTNAAATIGGGAVTLTATTLNFPSLPTLTWSLAGSGTLSATTGASITWTPPTSGMAGMSMVVVSAPGGFMAVATLSYSTAPTLVLDCGSNLAMAAGVDLSLNATVSGSTAPLMWALTPAVGSVVSASGATASYRPPLSVTEAQGFVDVVVTASAGSLMGSCTVRVFTVTLSAPSLVFVSGPPVPVTATVRGVPMGGTWSLMAGSPGSLSNLQGLSVDFRPPHEPGRTGLATLLFTTPQGVVRGAMAVDERPNRGLTVVAWGLVPALSMGTPATLSPPTSFVSTGLNSIISATRLSAGRVRVTVDGLSVAARNTTIETTGVQGRFCSVEEASLNTFTVQCVDAPGTATDSAFNFGIVQDDLSAGGAILAYGVVPDTTVFPTSLSGSQGWSATGTLQVTNPQVGTYQVSLGTLPAGASVGAVLVTPQTPDVGRQRCSLFSAAGAPSIELRCIGQSVPVNAGFSFVVMGRGVVSEATIDLQATIVTSPDGGLASGAGATSGAFGVSTAQVQTGVYRVNLGAPLVRGQAPVVANASTRTANATCITSVFGSALPPGYLECYTPFGGRLDTGFDFTVTSRGRPSLANVTGYAFIDNGGASSTPPTATAFNANGGAITSTRRGVGDYRVTFTNLALTNATAVATAFGTARRCAVESVLNDDVDVRCYGATNQPLDSQFFVTVHEWNSVSTARVMAYARVSALGSTRGPAFTSNPGGALTAARTGTGTYTVTLTGLLAADARNLSVTAENSNRFCSIFSRNVPVIAVECHDGAGPADSDFSLVAFTDQPFTSLTQPVTHAEVLAFAFASDPAAASYTPFVVLSYNSGRQAITATRSGPGVYAMRFPGLSFNSGVVQVTPTDTVNRCAVQTQLDDTVSVRCYGPSGVPTDSRYLLSFVR